MLAIFLRSLIIVLGVTPLILAGHIDNNDLPEGCGSCHVGHGMSQQPMLNQAEEHACYECHGSEAQRSRTVADGRLAAGARPDNIELEFKKQYRHPVENEAQHSPTERLPELDGAPADHAECVDCHNPHTRNQTLSQVEKVSGYSIAQQYLDQANAEYEICLKCHSDNESRLTERSSVRSEFDLNIKSQHPVTKPTQGKRSISLLATASGSLTMKCSDCHTNDDPNGPKGPHGSRYRFLLSGNYEIDVYADETPWAYQFCYSCHDRNNILSNQSFKYHRQHIEGELDSNRSGTSCYTCHASHGSTNEKLISFNLEAVSPGGTFNRIEYQTLGSYSGSCTLTCHDHLHDQVEY